MNKSKLNRNGYKILEALLKNPKHAAHSIIFFCFNCFCRVSVEQEKCYHCNKPKPFFYASELKEEFNVYEGTS